MEQRIAHIETDIGELKIGIQKLSSDLGDFILFVKQQFERQEKVLDTLLECQKQHTQRLNTIEATMNAIQQAFWFKEF